MPLTNYERQKKWRNKHRGIYNLRRRNSRKNLSGDASVIGRKAADTPFTLCKGPVSSSSSQPSKVDELRQLMAKASAEPSTPVKPMIYRDDYGRTISERQWNALQALKGKAKAGGYEIDEYSQ
jgi:hypothetical protein